MRLDYEEALNIGLLGRVDVYLDGERIENKCFEFDSDEGWADCYVYKNGEIVVDGDSLRTERLTGNITYKIKPISQ